MLNSLQQLETLFFFLLSVHLEGNVDWKYQDCFKLCYFPGLPAKWLWGPQKQKRHLYQFDRLFFLKPSPDPVLFNLFVVLLKISTIAE